MIDKETHCGAPDEVCLQFGRGVQFVIDRKMGKRISKEEAGLVHCTNNRQQIDFLCNCCACHCVILPNAMRYPRPGLALNSGFKPHWNWDLCKACETCMERCPMNAVSMTQEDVPIFDLERCIGCGACATGCPSEAIEMEERPGIPVPPVDNKALKVAMRNGLSPYPPHKGRPLFAAISMPTTRATFSLTMDWAKAL